MKHVIEDNNAIYILSSYLRCTCKLMQELYSELLLYFIQNTFNIIQTYIHTSDIVTHYFIYNKSHPSMPSSHHISYEYIYEV